MKNRTDNF